MKIIAIILFANIGYALCVFEADDAVVTQEIRDVVNKYKRLSTGNAEFSQRIEKLYYMIPLQPALFPEKIRAVTEFKHYDRERQRLEDDITERINRLKTIIRLRKGENVVRKRKIKSRIGLLS
ncbi:uncharacterized protein LOC108141641 [Drosophila elegans]|uniref:uncharacterized protein LOC108141641 n=1 Tax=Drosophila elegans TaxID=30023 RepID=UPI0007E5F3E2|nr:uncharacterized protein LOC108141641 [Drosophila elegans]